MPIGTGVFGTSGELNAAFSGFGGAANSLFGSEGNSILAEGERQSAAYLRKAEGLSRENVNLSRDATAIKQKQAQRNIEKVIGGQQADVAGAGFISSGSALDLLADSKAQADLTHYLIGKQGDIDANGFQVAAEGYAAQASAQLAAAKAHENAAEGGAVAGAISGVAGLAQLAMFVA